MTFAPPGSVTARLGVCDQMDLVSNEGCAIKGPIIYYLLLSSPQLTGDRSHGRAAGRERLKIPVAHDR